MNSFGYVVLKCGLVLHLIMLASQSQATEYLGRVVGVHDGDTVTVLDNGNVQHKVRLGGLDAPEKHQAYGAASKQNLAAWVYGKTVTVDTNKVDRYRREVGKVMLDGTDVNLEQIKAGLGWHYKQYEHEQPVSDRRLYADAEATSREKKIGLWADVRPIPPWEYRHTKK